MAFHTTRLLLIAMLTLFVMGSTPLYANTLSTLEDTSVTLTQSFFEDNFDSSNTLTKIKIIELPTKGTLKKGIENIQINQEINASDLGTVSFSPNTNENGTTTFKWIGNDLTDSDAITVTITITPVNDPPVPNSLPASGQTISVNEGDETAISLSASDAENDSLSYAVSTAPQFGSATINGSTLTYVHDGSESTSDTIQYTANDGSDTSSPASITITINPVNDPPVPNSLPASGQTISVNEGDETAISLSASDAENDYLSFAVSTAPQFGSATINGSTLTYVHDGSESTSDTIQYTANDGSDTSSPASITITITPVNDPPVPNSLPASGQTISVNEGDETAISLSASDAENDSLSFAVSTAPQFGSATINGSTLTYVHDGSESTSDTIQYTANDGSDTSSPASITITITPVNDPPVPNNLPASGQTISVNEGDETAISLSASDAENDSLSFAVSTAPQFGSATINGSSLTYVHDGSESTSDTIQYTANDGSDTSSPASITITITPVNDPPVPNNLPASGQTISVNEGDETAISLSASDAENDSPFFRRFNSTPIWISHH